MLAASNPPKVERKIGRLMRRRDGGRTDTGHPARS